MTPTRLLLNLVLPCTVLTGAWLAVPVLAALPLSLAGVRNYGAWALLALAAVIALSFRRGRIVFALLTLAAAYAAFTFYSLLPPDAATTSSWRIVYTALCFFLPLDLALLCAAQERGILNVHGARRAGVLAAQILLTAWLAVSASAEFSARLYAPLFDAALFNTPVPHSGLAALLLGAGACAACWVLRRSPLDLAFSGAVIAVAFALHRVGTPHAFAAFIGAAALLFMIGLLQDTFRMAFRDELTGLPSRRDLNERLMWLGNRYVIAMLDVDHFKKFNDTHGHDVGDQVLKMVASKMAAVSGGGHAFRYGGEEFTVLFANRDLDHALPHLETLRQEIERHSLSLRAPDRPETEEDGRAQRGKPRGGQSVSVTISIGVAARSEKAPMPEDVLKAADKALYRAKRAGRNQVSI